MGGRAAGPLPETVPLPCQVVLGLPPQPGVAPYPALAHDDLLLVAVRQIHVQHVIALDAEHDPPQARHRHRPLALATALQRMQPVERFGQLAQGVCTIQGQQDIPGPADMRRMQPAPVATLEQPSQASVPDVPYRHWNKRVAYHYIAEIAIVLPAALVRAPLPMDSGSTPDRSRPAKAAPRASWLLTIPGSGPKPADSALCGDFRPEHPTSVRRPPE